KGCTLGSAITADSVTQHTKELINGEWIDEYTTYSTNTLHIPNYTKRAHYLEIPVMLRYFYRFNNTIGVFAQGGGYMSLLLSKNYNIAKEYGKKINTGEYVDYGLSVGAGVEFIKHFQIAATYNFGFTEGGTSFAYNYSLDSYTTNEGFTTSSKNRVLSVTLTCLF
ncbi:MAG: PorT family protein, partial [Prevotellaceae bacterium]|nr:PorT family protein [Prevotellaceae bacterium]